MWSTMAGRQNAHRGSVSAEQDTFLCYQAAAGACFLQKLAGVGGIPNDGIRALQNPAGVGSMRLRPNQAKYGAGTSGTKKDDIEVVRDVSKPRVRNLTS